MNPLKTPSQSSIGIWGLGRVGKAAVRYFAQKSASIRVFDARPLAPEELAWLAAQGAIPCSLDELLSECSQILPSPGVDCESYRDHYHGTWLNELDLFYSEWKKPIIAITGSVGKTTITHLITQLLRESGLRVCAAGNIGTPAFEILAQRDMLDAIVLEVSSFQLDHCTQFAPDLAVLTNFLPNHLDRHKTLENYFEAKYSIIKNQSVGQKALIPLELLPMITTRNPRSTLFTFGTKKTTQDPYYTILNHVITRVDTAKSPLIDMQNLPSCTFAINWLIAYSALDIMKINLKPLSQELSLEHRLEKVATIKGVTFYNDSKSTVPLSTAAALENIHASRIMLFLGGLSKGIDRKPFIQSLRDKPVYVFCFGKEAEMLHAACQASHIRSIACQTLDEAFSQCIQQLQSGDSVLFSPAGSSFDLFKNYEERGKYFKNAVLRYQSSVESQGN